MAPSAAVVVRAPAHAPSSTAGFILKMYFPANSPITNGTVVTAIPASNRLNPLDFKPPINPGPAPIPTTAMKVFRPTLLNTHRAGPGMRPNVRFTERSQPQISPATNAPPLV